MVRDKATRENYPASVKLVERLDSNARNGLILRIAGNRIAFSSPLSVRVRRALDDTYRDVQELYLR